jgi:hypothetical protein
MLLLCLSILWSYFYYAVAAVLGAVIAKRTLFGDVVAFRYSHAPPDQYHLLDISVMYYPLLLYFSISVLPRLYQYLFLSQT